MKTEWMCQDALKQRWAREVFIESMVKVREIEDRVLGQKWFELRVGRGLIYVFPSRILGPLSEAVQVMQSIVEEEV